MSCRALLFLILLIFGLLSLFIYICHRGPGDLAIQFGQWP